MLKAIKIELFQQSANFRKPASFLVKESYPIVPYSTAMGMIHAACGFDKTHNFLLSVHSVHGGETTDLATLYNFGISYDETRHFAKVKNSKGKYDGINRGVRGIQLLTDVETVIYVVPPDEDYEVVLDGLRNPKNYLSLGRYEDIVRVDSVEEVELQKYEEFEDDMGEEDTVKYNMYIPVDFFHRQSMGTVFQIRKKYTLDTKSGARNWDEIIKVKYVQKGVEPDIDTKKCWIDVRNTNLVCLV